LTVNDVNGVGLAALTAVAAGKVGKVAPGVAPAWAVAVGVATPGADFEQPEIARMTTIKIKAFFIMVSPLDSKVAQHNLFYIGNTCHLSNSLQICQLILM
jgi:hypothetical protein